MSSPSLPDTVGLYSGGSMLGTLTPGDKIETREFPFADMRPGDVILFSREGKKIIHRITGGSAETGWITRGDNNGTDDIGVVTADDLPLLAVSRTDCRGNSFPVLNGPRGLAHHRECQRKRNSRQRLSRLIPPWCRNAPLRFLLPHHRFSTVSFGGLTVLYWGERSIATKKAGKPWSFQHRWMRLFFPLPKE